MGYSAAVLIKPSLFQHMKKFMAKHYRPWPELIGFDPEARYVSLPTDKLDYTHGKYHIGFNFRASSEEREYMFVVLRWMSLMAGSTSTRIPGYEGSRLRWYRYDMEKCPFLFELTGCKRQRPFPGYVGCRANRYGLLKVSDSTAKLWDYSWDEFEGIVGSEMKRLTGLWFSEG